MADQSRSVRLADFRNETVRLVRLVRVDYNACKGLRELSTWANITRRVLADVESITCRRASALDRASHQSAIEAAHAKLSEASSRIEGAKVIRPATATVH